MPKQINTEKDFNQITLRLASPEDILSWSYGEVTKPETINYRTGRSERGGLFDERIFGPEKDYECYCGKYKRIRFKDIICEKCGVEVTRSIVRRERMGHIELATPVSHIWFLRGIPSRMSVLLDITVTKLEQVVYFAGYIIYAVREKEKNQILEELTNEYSSKLKSTKDADTKDKLKLLFRSTKKEIEGIVVGKVLSETQFHSFSLRYGVCFDASIGAESIYEMLKKMDMKELLSSLEKRLEKAGKAEKEKLTKRILLLRLMINSGVRPEWMFLTVIPVIPPMLRPMVALDGGRHATSDLNDLYRRVINRNNRLKKLKNIGAPDVILRNEKRIIQEAVDALIDNSIASRNDSRAMSQSQRRPLKSLADNLKGKQGIFRQNLLGKRVDYSARSVIVVGPNLKLNQCGLPKHMALELFRPFVISKMIEQELAFNIRAANRLIEEGISEVWAILEKVISGKYVLLNRAPTLHRLGIQAFQPVLIEGNAIQVHPLVCTAFNADFDGDQMAVYLPLSEEAQDEAKNRMASNKNLLKPQDGSPIITPKLDIVLGCYWMTKAIDGEKGEGKYFANPNQAITAFNYGTVSFRAKINVMKTDSKKYEKYDEIFETSIGRLLFNSSLPSDFPFLNEEITKKTMSNLIEELIYIYGIDHIPNILDKIKYFGYHYVTFSGITWGIDSVTVPEEKSEIIKTGRKEAEEIESQFNEGLLSEQEKYRKILGLWEGKKQEIEKIIPEKMDKNSSVYDMVFSGARGSIGNITQMVGMKGFIVNTAGKIIDFPIIPSYKEGLSPLEYFITTHGARKGLADTALNTAKAGYLTRRLVDVSQDVVITEKDCRTTVGRKMTAENISGVIISLSRNVFGRVLAEEVKDKKGKIIFKKGHLISKEDAKIIENTEVESILVRSPLTCKTIHGLCSKCYGLDLGRNNLVELGEAVGVIAAQAIGEPGTQLTLRTFHAGGVSGGTDITQGLPRVEEIFERRLPKHPAVVAKENGVISGIKELESGEKSVEILGDSSGVDKSSNTIEYIISTRRRLIVKQGDVITKGQLITDGSAIIQEVFKYGGRECAEKYIIYEINKVYELQGAPISRKHIEIIIRQMLARRKIKDSGDTRFGKGEVVELIEFLEENKIVSENNGHQAVADELVLGISEVSLTTKSWLSASSFQNTSRVLIANAIRGGVDSLRGLKENVIIGRLIPVGTGFNNSKIEDRDDEEENTTE